VNEDGAVLTHVACEQTRPADKLKKLSDGGGLQLWIQPSGARGWRFAYRYGGRQKVLPLGPFPLIKLAEARELRDEAKRKLLRGIDPSFERRLEREAAKAVGETFEKIAGEYIAKLEREGRAPNTISKVTWLLGFANARLGARPIAELKPKDVLQVLRAVETRGRYESARRLRSTMGAVFRYAVATGRAESDPTLALKGALTTPQVTPRAAITDPKELGALLRAIDAFEGQPTTRAALQLMALLFPRPGELRAAEWPEFDLDAAVWTVPAVRTKMRREHKVPLAPQAIAILKEVRCISTHGDYVFASVRSWRRCMSDGTLNAALRRLGYAKDEVTAHGFRATASTLLNESGLWHPDAIERQLAHVEANEVRRSYARGAYWEERVAIMRWWADYLDDLKSGQNKRRADSPGSIPGDRQRVN
jgi:integrase